MKENPERRVIELLQQIIDMDKADRDALPGTVVKKVKDAQIILKKRRR